MFKKFKYSSDENILSDLSPIKKHVPEWYKNIPGITSKNLKFDENNMAVLNVKNCIPFLDSLTTGYAIELYCDIHVEILKNGHPFIRWNHPQDPVGLRPDSKRSPISIPAGHYDDQFVWVLPFNFQTPKGYSILMTHPLNRFDLPFTTMSGIADSDYLTPNGHVPFFIKKDFEGIISAGTPIVQIIPFKRDNWKSEKDSSLIKKNDEYRARTQKHFLGFYKNNLWNKKTFE